jgi:hypothetical protein
VVRGGRGRSRSRGRFLGALVVVSVVLTGCAIPTETRPSIIASSHVPFHLLEPDLPTTTTTQPPLSSLVSVKIFLLGANQQLAAVQRLIDSPAPLFSVIHSLVVGPTSSEAAGGTTTAIPTDVAVLSVTTQNKVVTVNFNAAFAQITGASTELAVSQVVDTVASQNGLTTGVIFEISGVRTSVPISSGAEVLGPVYALNFVKSAATTTTPTTAAPAAP